MSASLHPLHANSSACRRCHDTNHILDIRLVLFLNPGRAVRTEVHRTPRPGQAPIRPAFLLSKPASTSGRSDGRTRSSIFHAAMPHPTWRSLSMSTPAQRVTSQERVSRHDAVRRHASLDGHPCRHRSDRSRDRQRFAAAALQDGYRKRRLVSGGAHFPRPLEPAPPGFPSRR